MTDLAVNDVRAAVAAGVIDEAQAAHLMTIANDRKGFRENMRDEDEPFELFKGFSEIFVTVGLGILFSGILAVSALTNSATVAFIVAITLSVSFAFYFTLRRRMTLPSIALACIYAVSMAGLLSLLMVSEDEMPDGWSFLLISGIGAVAMLAYFIKFRVPFAVLLVGVFCGGIAFSIAGIIAPEAIFASAIMRSGDGFFDLGRNPTMAWTMLLFGMFAFLAGMYFDMKDPHRISRFSACGFWLHLLAAPAIVNVITMSLLNIGGVQGYLFATIALLVITIFALIIDRRSFLTAGIFYIGLILIWAMESATGDEGINIILVLISMGTFITALGTWWVQIRAALMRKLPDFAFKKRLPPYAVGKV